MQSLTASDALADAAVAQGWWTATNAGPAAPPAPDVPSDGLLVQGGASEDQPTAFAALIYELPPGQTAVRLTLHVAQFSATIPTATLRLCGLTTPGFAAVQGGPLGDAPAYDCKRTAASVPGADGASFEFRDIGRLVEEGILAFAVIPGATADRVVLTRPAADSLAVSAALEPAPPLTSPELSPEPGSLPVPPDANSESGGSRIAVLPAQVPTPVGASPAPPPAVARAADPDVVRASSIQGATVAGTTSPGRTGPLLIASLLLATALWTLAGREPTPRGLDTASA